MARLGRPPIDDPKDTTVRARMTAEDIDKLNYCCEQTRKTRSEVIRDGINRTYQELTQKQ